MRRLGLALSLLAAGPAAATAATGWAESRLAEVVHEVEPTLQRWGYPAVAGVAALDYVGVPMPADTMLVAATLASARGDLRLPTVLVMAVLGMIAGSQLGFGLGRWGGRALLRRVPLAPERVAAVERRYTRWGAWLVLASPFLDGVRQLNALTAGMLGMGWWRFTALNAVAAMVWAGAWAGATLVIEEHVADLLPLIRSAKPWLILAAIVAAAGLLWHLRRRQGEPPAATSR